MENQIEDLKVRMEQMGLSSDQIDEVLASSALDTVVFEPSPKGIDIIFELWKELEKAQRWQDKVRIQAKIISEKLDDY